VNVTGCTVRRCLLPAGGRRQAAGGSSTKEADDEGTVQVALCSFALCSRDVCSTGGDVVGRSAEQPLPSSEVFAKLEMASAPQVSITKDWRGFRVRTNKPAQVLAALSGSATPLSPRGGGEMRYSDF